MSFEFLETLLNRKNYIKFLRSLPFQKVKRDNNEEFLFPEIEEWLTWFNNDSHELSKVLEEIAEKLLDKHYEVIYPIESIIIPRYPFSKKPMISWQEFQFKPFTDYQVNKLKYICSRLGNLINTYYIPRHLIVIDFDKKIDVARKYADVETRRGFHIIRYIEKYEAIETKIGETSGFRVGLQIGDIHIDIISGNLYLVSHPLQSRYLEFDGKKVNVRNFKLLSKEAYYCFKSGDWTPLKASVQEIEELIKTILKELNANEIVDKIQLKPHEKIEITTTDVSASSGIPKKESRYNQNPSLKISTLIYNEFKEKLRKYINYLPICLKKALFETVPEGTRFFHGQFLRAILPYFVYLDDQTIYDVINDCFSRWGKKRSDYTKIKYYWLYFTGKLKVDDKVIRTASNLKLRSEVWSCFYSLGYCNECILRDRCLKLSNSERKKLIIDYIRKILNE